MALDWCAALEVAESQVAKGEYAQAINTYSELLRRSDIEGGAAAAPGRHAALLLARSAAYAQLSQHLRGIPAAESERSAILAPDPCHLAALAAQDADAVLALRPACPEALLHKGHGLFLQERYGQAEEAYRAGLDLQPTHEALLARLADLHAALHGPACGASGSSDASGARLALRCRQPLGEADEEVDCPICSRMLFDPVTTPCGHTFCASCFRRSMDHACRCPLCRTVGAARLSDASQRAFCTARADCRKHSSNGWPGTAVGGWRGWRSTSWWLTHPHATCRPFTAGAARGQRAAGDAGAGQLAGKVLPRQAPTTQPALRCPRTTAAPDAARLEQGPAGDGSLCPSLPLCRPAADYAARREEEARVALGSAAEQAPLPLFVMTLLLPGEELPAAVGRTARAAQQARTHSMHSAERAGATAAAATCTCACAAAGQSLALNIFEPRYRLLVRRAMAGNRRFGMAAVDGRQELCEASSLLLRWFRVCVCDVCVSGEGGVETAPLAQLLSTGTAREVWLLPGTSCRPALSSPNPTACSPACRRWPARPKSSSAARCWTAASIWRCSAGDAAA